MVVLAALHNAARLTGRGLGELRAVVSGAGAFVGLSAGRVAEPAVASMAPDAFGFAMANLEPSIYDSPIWFRATRSRVGLAPWPPRAQIFKHF